MNVFEDLIVELKQENLLERTVIDDHPCAQDDLLYLDETEVPNIETQSLMMGADPVTIEEVSTGSTEVELDGYDAHLEDTDEPNATQLESQPHKKPRNGQEFYRKRAMSEVSNLQMVEHVLTGVEREFMKVKPRVYDDFSAKKALNAFLQVNENENSTEHKEAEFKLMTETEAWCTALAERDHDILVSNLRQYCENSRPPLSSQALVSLARFYRNLPYKDAVRSKFDFVITRLFSRPTENEMRTAVFTHEETLGHLHTLYRDWSSIAFYGVGDDESKLSLAALSFEDLAIEAENAGTFDQLIDSNFFQRVRGFKDSIGEMFYAPNVLSAAIDANIRIGNAYVNLIDLERRKMDADSIQSKYGDKHDDTVSEGIGRTLELVDILRSPLNPQTAPSEESTQEFEQESFDLNHAPAVEKEVDRKPRPAILDKVLTSIYSINRWVAGFSFLMILLTIGVYVYANFFVEEKSVVSANVRAMVLDDPLYKDYVQSASISGDTLYTLLLPTWDGLTKEKKQEILVKLYQNGKDKDYSKVNLVNKDGKSAGFASATRLDIVN